MRSRILMFLLLLSILIHNAQGIRLIVKGSAAADHSLLSLHEKFEGTGMRSNEGDEDGKKKKQWSGRSIRKLTMITITKNDEEIKVEKNNTAMEEQNLSVNSPEIIDIAAMDYNLARRKPPIHN